MYKNGSMPASGLARLSSLRNHRSVEHPNSVLMRAFEIGWRTAMPGGCQGKVADRAPASMPRASPLAFIIVFLFLLDLVSG